MGEASSYEETFQIRIWCIANNELELFNFGNIFLRQHICHTGHISYFRKEMLPEANCQVQKVYGWLVVKYWKKPEILDISVVKNWMKKCKKYRPLNCCLSTSSEFCKVKTEGGAIKELQTFFKVSIKQLQDVCSTSFIVKSKQRNHIVNVVHS